MKKIKYLIVMLVAFVMCFTLCACGNKYVSRYSATLMVKTNTSNKAHVSFGTFKGTYVMQLKNKGTDETCIRYEAKLGEGHIKVYYDLNGEKVDFFEIESNGVLNGKTETFTGNKTIYIIIETDVKCNEGDFTFVLEKV